MIKKKLEEPSSEIKTESEEKKEKVLTPLQEAREVNKEKERLLKLEMEILDRREKLEAEIAVGGRAEAGSVKQKEELTNKEIADRVIRGELNPLKEDGFTR